ncbi:Ribokinase [Paenibacillus allorhizoplanae]|uniref:Ribokinase n=1 Tax=Paenibacillus allorhizoplanae TaxID=2905648 RepID=A0ABM9CME5_9BACL|nr:ribokinase [Paenibacillus allorhizoplanae]CAH1217705.1 Ribokinase [Paenibacillus allorhizoplanae]
MKNIYVVGSINMDIVNKVHHFPHPAETVEGQHTAYYPGGKGANQAVAAAMSGSNVQMVGAIGNDAFGTPLFNSLLDKGVQVGHVKSKESGSGLALITVNEEGENCIMLSRGANEQLSGTDLPNEMWDDAALILLQNEISWDINLQIIHKAKECGIPVWMNPAPALLLPNDIYASIHTLILNETEAGLLTDRLIVDENDALLAITQLINKGIAHVVLTLGSKGLIIADETKQITYFDAYLVNSVDTTAAGDTFIGTFASSWLSGQTLCESMQFASAAAAIAVTKPGAQDRIPSKSDIEAFIYSNPTPYSNLMTTDPHF